VAEYATSKQGPDLEREDRLEQVFKRFQDARDGLNEWREEARESYDFESGMQWSPDDIAQLQEQERPAVTFNRMGVMVDAVAGLEVNTRQSVTYYPRERGDVAVSELETAAANWVRDQCHGEDQESEAFRDAIICGVGCTETLMNYDEDPDGMIVEERRDPMKVFWDPAAHKRCNSDARYIFYADWMDNREIEETWPDKYVASTPWDRIDDAPRPQNADLMFLYKDKDGDWEKHKDQSLVVQYQCWWREEYYRVADPQSGELVSFEKGKFEKIRKAYKDATGQDLKFVKQKKKVYYRGFYCGRTELEYGKSPCQESFTFKFITCKRDRNRKMWYGLVRAMKDPQRWANKWLSQILHIINTNAKGGAFVETNALKDPRKAEEQWAASNPLIELNEGGIEKIKERTPAQAPNGLDKLMNFAFESLPYVSGINLEALGLANREQAGVLEAQRRKAAYGILAPLFDALRLYRKEQGRLLLFFIREFISDGRLIRVIGQNGQKQYLPLVKREDTAQYDLIIDQSPQSPDFREKTWEAFKELLPVMMKEGIPIPPTLFDYAPIPADVANELKGLVQLNIPKMREQMQGMQQQLQKAGQQINALTQENQQLKGDRSIEAAKVAVKANDSAERNALKKHQIDTTAMIELVKSNREVFLQALGIGAETHARHEERKSNERVAEKKAAAKPAATPA